MVRPDFMSSAQAPVAGGRRTPLGAATEPRRLLGASQFLEGEPRNLGRIKKAPLADFDDLCCHQLRKRIASVHETQRLQRLFIRSHQSRAFLRRNFKILQQSYDRHIPFLREAGQCPGTPFVADGTRVRGMGGDRGIRGTQGTKSQTRARGFRNRAQRSVTARASHSGRSRSVKARKDAQPMRAGTASIGSNDPSKCHLAPTPRNGRTSLYRQTTSHAQSFANQRRRNSLGFTKTKSRSTSSRLTA